MRDDTCEATWDVTDSMFAQSVIPPATLVRIAREIVARKLRRVHPSGRIVWRVERSDYGYRITGLVGARAVSLGLRLRARRKAGAL